MIKEKKENEYILKDESKKETTAQNVVNQSVQEKNTGSNVNNQNSNSSLQKINSVVPNVSDKQTDVLKNQTKSNNSESVNYNGNNQNFIQNNQNIPGVKPEYQSQYDSQIAGLLDKILNGEKFDYDVNSDALFANYADVYERNARKTAEDALGRSAASSGGYGNSYAAAIAGQAYNSQMQGLNEIVPQLQELAYQQYLAEKEDEYNKLSMLKSLDDSNYLKYRDSMSDYYTDRDYAASREDTAWEKQFATDQFDYNKQQDVLAQQNWEKEYNASREDAAWEKQYATDQFDYNKQQDVLAQQNWEKEYNANRADSAWEKQYAQNQFDASREDAAWEKQYATDQFDYNKQQDILAQENWQKEYEANRADSAWEQQYAQNQFEASREDAEWDKQFATDQFEYGKEQDAQNQSNIDREFDANREDAEWNKQFATEQFEYEKAQDAAQAEFNKMVWENEARMDEALVAAEYGDYSLLELYTGADLKSAKEWDEIMKGTQIYSATGLVDYLKSAGVNTAQLEDNISNEKYADQLSMAISIYESTGSPQMLKSLGIDTSYMDKILGYTLMEAQKSANGSTGGSGGGSYSSSSSTSKSNSSNKSSFTGNDTTSYWINDRLTDKQLKNYNSRKGTNISLASYAGDQLAIALSNNQITKEEYIYLCDYYGIK